MQKLAFKSEQGDPSVDLLQKVLFLHLLREFNLVSSFENEG